MKCKRCGSADIVLFKDTHRCSVCDSTNIIGIDLSRNEQKEKSVIKSNSSLAETIGKIFAVLLTTGLIYFGGSMFGTSKVDLALNDAAREGNIEAAKKTIAAGADVNAKSGGGLAVKRVGLVFYFSSCSFSLTPLPFCWHISVSTAITPAPLFL